ncbi:unnamed protein product, partial [Ectocarpus sp. 4 AP-2014]
MRRCVRSLLFHLPVLLVPLPYPRQLSPLLTHACRQLPRRDTHRATQKLFQKQTKRWQKNKWNQNFVTERSTERWRKNKQKTSSEQIHTKTKQKRCFFTHGRDARTQTQERTDQTRPNQRHQQNTYRATGNGGHEHDKATPIDRSHNPTLTGGANNRKGGGGKGWQAQHNG